MTTYCFGVYKVSQSMVAPMSANQPLTGYSTAKKAILAQNPGANQGAFIGICIFEM